MPPAVNPEGENMAANEATSTFFALTPTSMIETATVSIIPTSTSLLLPQSTAAPSSSVHIPTAVIQVVAFIGILFVVHGAMRLYCWVTCKWCLPYLRKHLEQRGKAGDMEAGDAGRQGAQAVHKILEKPGVMAQLDAHLWVSLDVFAVSMARCIVRWNSLQRNKI
ncbi:hypothetical protein BJ741DRAFT_697432 [Chytriomyces cf. hyalinus JEL632]|nr:hypothetical protein BJ741DRAFT_697432 [Chytriomyces cf. hyalinus JEL632]